MNVLILTINLTIYFKNNRKILWEIKHLAVEPRMSLAFRKAIKMENFFLHHKVLRKPKSSFLITNLECQTQGRLVFSGKLTEIDVLTRL